MERIAYRIYDAERKVFHYSGSTPSMLESFFRHTAVLNTFHKSEYQQLTGLEDCNGKDIYEGDLLKAKTGLIGSVHWDESALTYRVTWFKVPGSYLHIVASWCEVIGNICENPELLAG